MDRDQTLIEIQIHNPFRSGNLILIFHILMVQMPWIISDRFFDYYNIPNLVRISIASMHLDKGVVP